MTLRISKVSLFIFSLFWLSSLTVFYYSVRRFYLYPLSLLFVFLTFRWYLKKLDFTFKKFKISIYNLLPLGFALIFLDHNLLGISTQKIRFDNFLLYEFILLRSLFLSVLALIIISAAAFILGKKIFNQLRLTFSSFEEEFIFALGLGFVLLIYFALILGFFHLLYAWVVFLILAFVFLRGTENIKYLLKEFRTKKLTLSNVYLLLVFWVLVASFSAQLKPLALEWDSISFYISNVRLLVENHQLISTSYKGLFTYNLELLLALAYFFGGYYAVMLFSPFMGLLSGITLGTFTRKFFSEKIDTLSVAILFSTPTFMFLSLAENKTDLGLLFFSLLSVFAFFNYLKNKDKNFLILTGLFLGVSFAIKYTAGFLMAAVFITFLLISVFIERDKITSTIKSGLLLGVFTLIPFLPWVFIMPENFYPRNLGALSFFYPKSKLLPPPADFEKFSACLKERIERSMGVYVTGYSLKDRLLQPVYQIRGIPEEHSLFHRHNLGLIYFPLSFLFFLYFLSRRRPESPPFFKTLLIIILFYFLFWEIISFEVYWYALPGFALLSMILAYFIESIEEPIFKKMLSYFLFLNIFLSIAFHSLAHAAGVLLPLDKSLQEIMVVHGADAYEMSVKINTLRKKEVRVFVSMVYPYRFVDYFVKQSDTVLVPNSNYIFNYDNSFEAIRTELKKIGTTHLLSYNREPEVGLDCTRKGLEKEKEFLKRSGKLVYKNSTYSLYELD